LKDKAFADLQRAYADVQTSAPESGLDFVPPAGAYY